MTIIPALFPGSETWTVKTKNIQDS